MNRHSRNRVWSWPAALAGLAFMVSLGCGPSTLWHLWKGEQPKDPDYPIKPLEGKEEIVLAVSVTPTANVPPGLELDLASKIGSQIQAVSDANKGYKFRIVDASKVNNFRMTNPDLWNRGNAGDFAKKLGADYWLDVTMHSFSLIDNEFAGELCRGRATLNVVLYESGNTTPKFQYPLSSEATLRPNNVSELNIYRDKYIGQLATQIAFKHVKYKKPQEDALLK